MVDMLICSCCFEPPFAEALLGPSCVYLLLKQVDLGFQCLALFVHGLVAVNFSHKTPIVLGKLVKGAADGGESGPAPDQC